MTRFRILLSCELPFRKKWLMLATKGLAYLDVCEHQLISSFPWLTYTFTQWQSVGYNGINAIWPVSGSLLSRFITMISVKCLGLPLYWSCLPQVPIFPLLQQVDDASHKRVLLISMSEYQLISWFPRFTYTFTQWQSGGCNGINAIWLVSRSLGRLAWKRAVWYLWSTSAFHCINYI